MSEFLSSYGGTIVSLLITSALTFVITFVVTKLRALRENYEYLKGMKEQNREFQKLFYKQALWTFYNEFKEGDKLIPPERYAFAKHQFNKYVELDGNGTTQFEFEKIERIYQAQQKLEEEKKIEAWRQGELKKQLGLRKEGEHHE